MRKSFIYISVLVIAFSAKGYAQQETGSGSVGSLMINWPAEYEPSKAKFFVHNRIHVNAPPEIGLIVPDENGCTVITDESQFGWLTFFEKLFQPNKLRRLHDIWLAEIKCIAESRYEELNPRK